MSNLIYLFASKSFTSASCAISIYIKKKLFGYLYNIVFNLPQKLSENLISENKVLITEGLKIFKYNTYS